MQNNWALILAAGTSQKVGVQELLLPYNRTTIIQRVVENVLSSRVDNVMVVVGFEHEKIRAAIGRQSVVFCHNPNAENGVHSSVMCGFKALPDDANAALIYPGDHPEISPSITNIILEAYNKNLFGIVIPVNQYRRGHPLLVDMKYRNEIHKLDLGTGLASLRHQFPEDVLEVEITEPGNQLEKSTLE